MKEPKVVARQFSIWIEIIAGIIMAVGSIWNLVFTLLVNLPLSIFGNCYYRGGGLLFDEWAYDMIQKDRIERRKKQWAKEDAARELS